MLKKLYIPIALLFTAQLSIAAPAQIPAGKDGVRTALVLSGGGARGIAHVGVLRALEEQGVEIDLITGTSIGSIIGGFYAYGLSVDQIDKIISTGTWLNGFRDVTSRADVPIHRKEDDFDSLGSYRFTRKENGSTVNAGFIKGQNILSVLRTAMPEAYKYKDFDDLPIPFRAVAMDLQTGDEVILDTGDITEAMRASMSIPAVFSPVPYKGTYLVDGGMANNMPVSVAKEMGADIVIAVNVGTPPADVNEVKGPLSMGSQLSSIAVSRTGRQQAKLLDSDDLLLTPKLDDVQTLDFSNIAVIADRGYRAAMAQAEKLASLGSEDSTIRADRGVQPFIINQVTINNHTSIRDEDLARFFDKKDMVNQPFNEADFEQQVSNLYSLKLFSEISYVIKETEDNQLNLIIDVQQDKTDLKYYQLGLDLSSSIGKGDSNSFSIKGRYNWNLINERGARASALVKLGSDILVDATFYQPLHFNSPIFIEPFYRYSANDVNDLSQLFTVQKWWVKRNIAGVNLGFAVNNNLQISTGPILENGRYYEEFTSESSEYGNFSNYGWAATLRYDNLNEVDIPQDGGFVVAGIQDYNSAWGSDVDYQHQMLDAAYFKTFNRNTLGLTFHYTGNQDAPLEPSYYTSLGGFQYLSGYSVNELSGRFSVLGALNYRYNISASPDSPIGWPSFVGASLERGNVANEFDQLQWHDLLWSASAYFGVRSPIGPLFISYGHSETGADAFYLTLGNLITRR